MTDESAGADHGGSRYFIRVRAGLIEPKHASAMGPAIWLYLYLHKYAGWKTGAVPEYTHAKAAAELGCCKRTVESMMQILRREGYVILKQNKHSAHVQITRYSGPEDWRKSDISEAQGSQDPVPLEAQGSQDPVPLKNLYSLNLNREDESEGTSRGAVSPAPPPAHIRENNGFRPAPPTREEIAADPEWRVALALYAANGGGENYEHVDWRVVRGGLKEATELIAEVGPDRALDLGACARWLGKKPTLTHVTLLMARQDHGKWVKLGRPTEWQDPRQRAKTTSAPVVTPALECYCGKPRGTFHRGETCGLDGRVETWNYREIDRPDWVHTPEGDFEDTQIPEQEGVTG